MESNCEQFLLLYQPTRRLLQAALADIDPGVLATALARLAEQGVVLPDGERLAASACARHIDALGMICI